MQENTNRDEQIAEYRRLKIGLLNAVQKTKPFCGICLVTDKKLFSFSDSVNIGFFEETNTTINCVIDSLLGVENPNYLSDQACEDCCYSAINAFIFKQNAKHITDIVENYIGQLDAKLDEINNKLESSSDISDFANSLITLDNPMLVQPIHNSYQDDNLTQSDSNQEEEYNIDLEEQETQKKIKAIKRKDGTFKCDMCLKLFRTKKGLVYHIQLHNDIKVETHANRKHKSRFSCPECPEIVCRHHKYLMSYKDQKLAGNKKIKCPDCDYVCFQKVRLAGHANKAHLKTFNFICEFCNKALHSKQAHTLHILNFHTKFHYCKNCNCKFKHELNLARHMHKCLKMPKHYKCDKCPAAFNTKLRLLNHKKRHKSSHSCELCNKVFTHEHLLENHLVNVHDANETSSIKKRHYICSICHNKYSTMKEKKDHMKTHGDNENHKCLVCNLEFGTLAQYITHIRSPKHLLKLNPTFKNKFKCLECDYSTTASDILEGHMNAHHLKIAPYVCPKCNRKFTSVRSLEHHVKNHDEEKSYSCHYCGGLFRCPSSVTMHIRRKHTGEKPYQCDMCEEKFVNASMKTNHMIRKHGEKNVKCPLCDLYFHVIPDMRTHFKKNHWKYKGEKFDFRRVQGLKEEDYDLFRDRRLIPFTCE